MSAQKLTSAIKDKKNFAENTPPGIAAVAGEGSNL